MQILVPHPRPTKSETGSGDQYAGCKSPLGDSDKVWYPLISGRSISLADNWGHCDRCSWDGGGGGGTRDTSRKRWHLHSLRIVGAESGRGAPGELSSDHTKALVFSSECNVGPFWSFSYIICTRYHLLAKLSAEQCWVWAPCFMYSLRIGKLEKYGHKIPLALKKISRGRHAMFGE